MTDFNTWNESLIDAVRKSSLFENEGANKHTSLCSRCEEIVDRLECIKGDSMSTVDMCELIQKDIDAITELRFEDVAISFSFTWDDTPWGFEYWENVEEFLEEHSQLECATYDDE